MPGEVLRRALIRHATAALLVLAAAAAGAQQPRADLLAACAVCHGPGGNSQTPSIPSIAGQPRVFVENQLVIIREGLREVPAMKAVMGPISDEEIAALARHYSALPAIPMAMEVKREPRLRGAELSRRHLCGTCHLADYTGQNQVPRLAGQHEAYLAHSLKQFRDHAGPGRDTIMSATLLGLSDADLADLAHYLASSRP